jgi:hypothetical protein
MVGNMIKNLIVLKNQDKILRLYQLKSNVYLQRTVTHSMWIYKTLSARLNQQQDKVAHLTFLIVVTNNYAISLLTYTPQAQNASLPHIKYCTSPN